MPLDVTPYLGRYRNGAELSQRDGALHIRWGDHDTLLQQVGDRLFAGPNNLSVGFLPGAPPLISVNDFLMIGALPGERM